MMRLRRLLAWLRAGPLPLGTRKRNRTIKSETITPDGERITPDGERVVLFEDTWSEHILAHTGHPELALHLEAVLAAISAPDLREPDERAHRERFFKANVGPSEWLMVVVDFEREPARIITALGYGHGRAPRGWTT
jgi:hypothetical protein